MPHVAEELTVEHVQSCSTIIQQTVGCSGGSRGCWLRGGKGGAQGMGDVCFQTDGAAWPAFPGFAPVAGQGTARGGGVSRGPAAAGLWSASCQRGARGVASVGLGSLRELTCRAGRPEVGFRDPGARDGF